MVILLSYCLIINCTIILLGYKLARSKSLVAGWTILFAVIGATCFIPVYTHPIIKMLIIVTTVFSCMKVIVLIQTYQKTVVGISFGRWVLFAFGWAGMRIKLFETKGGSALPNARPIILFGISRLIAGFVLIGLAHWAVKQPLNPQFLYALVSVLLLISYSLILHFGLLGISAGIWLLFGVNANLLFKQPLKATSITGFWSERWNIAFSEMTSAAIYKPLKSNYGKVAGLLLSFAFSGLLHELALSVPVNCGYGLPLLYFIIQGVMVIIEQSLLTNTMLLNNRLCARIWTFCFILLPSPLLFHSQFIKQIIWPLAGLHVFSF